MAGQPLEFLLMNSLLFLCPFISGKGEGVLLNMGYPKGTMYGFSAILDINGI